jgi:hypothetical protein
MEYKYFIINLEKRILLILISIKHKIIQKNRNDCFIQKLNFEQLQRV